MGRGMWMLALCGLFACASSSKKTASAQGNVGGASVSASVTVQASFFGVPLTGADEVVFVLDRSGSMSGEASIATSAGSAVANLFVRSATNGLIGVNSPSKLELAKTELWSALNALPDGVRFNVIFFNNSIHALSQEMVVLNPRTRLSAKAFIFGISSVGNTAAVPALRAAYSLSPKRVVFLSDGIANNGGGPELLLAEARTQMQNGVRFDAVGFGIIQDRDLMVTLAAESGGVAIIH